MSPPPDNVTEHVTGRVSEKHAQGAVEDPPRVQAQRDGGQQVRSQLGGIVGKQLSELGHHVNEQQCLTDLFANNLTEEDMHKIFGAKGVLAFPLVQLADDEKTPAFCGGTSVVGEIVAESSLDKSQLSKLLLRKREQLAADNARLVLHQDRHPLEAVEVIRYSLLIVAVRGGKEDLLPPHALEREQLKQRTRERFLHSLLLYPVDAVLAAVGRLWVLFVTNEKAGESIGKTLEALSSGELSVPRMASNDVWHSLSLDGMTRPNLLITCDGPTLAHFGQDIIHAYHLTADQIIRLEFAHRGQKLRGTSPIPETTPEDQMQVIIAPHPAQTL